MAKLIRCPKCQSQIDVTSVPGGATVRCADCDALVRIPTGSTGVYPKTGASIPAPAPAAAPRSETRVRTGGRQTDLFRKMSGARSPGGGRPPSRASVQAEARGGTRMRVAPRRNNMALITGISVAVVALMGVLLFLQMGNQKKRQSEYEANALAKNAEIRRRNEATMKQYHEESARLDEEDKKAEAAAKAAQKTSGSLKKSAGGGYEAPPTFEPGAQKQVRGGFEPIKTDPALVKEYETMAVAGRSADLVKDAAKWMPYIISGILSDDEKIARGSLQTISEFCSSRGLKTESGANPIKLEYFNSAYYRGTEYSAWQDWWSQPQNRVAVGSTDPKDLEEIRTKGEDPSKIDWDEIMKALRVAGGFDDPKRPEGMAFARLKGMGDKAYPFIIKYIDNEDLALGKAAVTVLNALTNRQSPLPNEGNKGQIKTEWETWAKK